MKLFKTVLTFLTYEIICCYSLPYEITFTIYMKVNVNADVWPATMKYELKLKSKIELITTYVHTWILPNPFFSRWYLYPR